VASGEPRPTSAPAAPSPKTISCVLAGRATRRSAASSSCAPSTGWRSAAASSLKAARALDVTSRSAARSGRPSAAATMPAFSRSAKGRVVDASVSVAGDAPGSACCSWRPASTAMVTLSSSQLAMVRRPLARPRRPGAIQRCWARIALRSSRRRGR
jgi:hypothetical protein